jgi:hypothetical protein
MGVPEIPFALVLGTGLAAVALLIGLAVIVNRLSAPAATAFDADLVSSFSVAAYRPMERLLAEEDFEFLASLPGFRACMGRALRRERRRIFRVYLRDLSKDFRMLHGQARSLLRDLEQDRPDLVVALVKQSLRFEYGLFLAHASLAFHWAGVEPAPAKQLVRSAEWMHEQLQALMASPMPLGMQAS